MSTPRRDASPLPPAGLNPDQCPLFLALTFDDNGYPDGLEWFLDLFASRRNPDGSPVRATFYNKTSLIEGSGAAPAQAVRAMHQRAVADGHELASHTHTHPHGVDIDWNTYQRSKLLDKAAWLKEIDTSLDILASLGVTSIKGFRTPFLEYNEDTYAALTQRGFHHDSSVEGGWMPGYDGATGVWPYTLHDGSPDEAWMSRNVFHNEPLIGSIPGLWEVPVSVLTVPADADCPRYGIEAGLRQRIKPIESYYRADTGRIICFDWNMWFEYGITHLEVAAIMCHSLDLRLAGNRAPLVYGGHTDIYSPLYEQHDMGDEEHQRCQASHQQRREAWRIFVDYALTKPQVRLVSVSDLLAWMQHPLPL